MRSTHSLYPLPFTHSPGEAPTRGSASMSGVTETSVPPHEHYCNSNKGGFNSCSSCRIGTAGNFGDSNSSCDSRDSHRDGEGDFRGRSLFSTKPFLAKPREISGCACGSKVTSAPEGDSACFFEDTVTAAHELDIGGARDGSVTSASEHKETSYKSNRPRDEANQDPRVSCVVECSVLLVKRHFTCV